MALPVIGGVARCAVKGLTALGTTWVNVHHMQYALGASSPGPTEINALDPLLARLYTGTSFTGGANWFNYCGTGTQLVEIDYTVLDGAALGITIPHPVTLSAGAPLPAEVAHVLTLITGHRGRRYRGRVYLPAVQSSNIDVKGNLTTTVQTAIQTQYMGMLAAMGAIQWTPVVASYGHGTIHKVPTTWTPFATPITSVRMDLQPDVQRRRKL